MLKKSMLLLCVLTLAGTFVAAGLASQSQTTTQAQTSEDKKQAADVKELEKQAGMLDEQAAKAPNNNDKVFSQLSKELDIPVATLQSEKQSSKLGFGELFIANALAKSSGKTFDQIVTEFHQGQGWGEIAKQNSVKLGPVVSGIKSANKAVGSEMNHANPNSQGASGGTPKGKGAPPATGKGGGRGRGSMI